MSDNKLNILQLFEEANIQEDEPPKQTSSFFTYTDYNYIDSLWEKLDRYGSKKLSIQELKTLCYTIEP